MAKTFIVGLKTDIIQSHPIYPVGSIKETIYINQDNPSVELSEEDANLVLTDSRFGNVFQIIGESGDAPLTKAELQDLYLKTLGTAPDKRLSVTALQAAIDDFNKGSEDDQAVNSGLADATVATSATDTIQ